MTWSTAVTISSPQGNTTLNIFNDSKDTDLEKLSFHNYNNHNYHKNYHTLLIIIKQIWAWVLNSLFVTRRLEPVAWIFFCFLFCSLGLHGQHMEFPRVGVELEQQLLAYATATATPDPSHVCYITAHSNAGSFNQLSGARELNPHPHGYKLGSLSLSHNRHVHEFLITLKRGRMKKTNQATLPLGSNHF